MAKIDKIDTSNMSPKEMPILLFRSSITYGFTMLCDYFTQKKYVF